MRMAIMGAGSLGTIIGALITKGGREIELIDINKEHVDALNNSGARITGFLDLCVPVKAIVPSEMTGTYDLVFLLTKQVYNKTTLAQLLPHLSEDSIVCTLQNGVPEDYVVRDRARKNDRRRGRVRGDMVGTWDFRAGDGSTYDAKLCV